VTDGTGTSRTRPAGCRESAASAAIRRRPSWHCACGRARRRRRCEGDGRAGHCSAVDLDAAGSRTRRQSWRRDRGRVGAVGRPDHTRPGVEHLVGLVRPSWMLQVLQARRRPRTWRAVPPRARWLAARAFSGGWIPARRYRAAAALWSRSRQRGPSVATLAGAGDRVAGVDQIDGLEQQRSLPWPSHELVPTSVPTFPWRRETPGYALKRSTYWNL
jgi:hypothetical protein